MVLTRRKIAVAVLLVGACAPSAAEHTSSTRSPVIGGTSSSEGAVVYVAVKKKSGEGMACGGVVVSPRVVLTPATCVHPSWVGEGATLRIFLGDRRTASDGDPASWVEVAESGFHPDFDNDPVEPFANNLGYLIASTPLPRTPLALRRSALSPAMVGQPVTMVGFGETVAGDLRSAYTRTAAQGPLASLEATTIHVGDETHTPCADHGGAVLLDEGGATTLIGLIADFTNASCSPPAVATRIDAFVAPFIDPLLAAHASDGDASAGDETTAGPPEPDGGPPATQTITRTTNGCTIARAPGMPRAPETVR